MKQAQQRGASDGAKYGPVIYVRSGRMLRSGSTSGIVSQITSPFSMRARLIWFGFCPTIVKRPPADLRTLILHTTMLAGHGHPSSLLDKAQDPLSKSVDYV